MIIRLNAPQGALMLIQGAFLDIFLHQTQHVSTNVHALLQLSTKQLNTKQVYFSQSK